jgi:2-amino-4,5-dihydroxy-6-oxo-7-(phosphonooxy)heptanoate synthase
MKGRRSKVTRSFGAQVRLERLYRHGDSRLLMVPLDHSVTDGPIVAERGLTRLVGQLAGNGADVVVLHKGSARHIDAALFTRIGLIVHLSASTMHAPDPDEKYLVSTVEEALRLGADAVSVHVNLGSREERQQVADLASVADVADRWNVPLLAMMYPRGPRITDPRDPALVAHAVTLAVDMGADMVKVPLVRPAAAMADLVRCCPVPLIVAGGPRIESTAELLSTVSETMRSGVAGLAMGRNIFQAPDPARRALEIARLIHPTFAPSGQPQLELATT